MENQIAPINDEFLEEFECPICTRYILPPIRQCVNGHCFCDDCFDKIRICALCRASKSPHRSVTLEKVQACLFFPCPYVDEGCDLLAPCKVISEHQKYCKFSWAPCPLRFNGCRWRGEKPNLVVHCREQHVQNIYFTSKQTLLSSNFVNPIDRLYYILFYVYNNIFRCTWDLQKDTGLIRFTVYCLAKPLQQDKFSYTLSFLDRDNSTEVVTMKAPCHLLEDDSKRFVNKMYFTLHHDYVKDFCDEEGNLNYSVNILQKK